MSNRAMVPTGEVRKELLSRILAKKDLLHFTQRCNPRYKAGWVHRDICRRLEKFSQDVADEKSPRLILMMPPRHGKSEIASRNLPPWHLGRNPTHEFIACSYNVALTMTFSRRIKEVMQQDDYTSVFETRLNPNHQSAEEWGLQGQPGGYVAAGVGGGITGKGAHVLLIDDPIKNAEDADNADFREKLWTWFTSTAYTRLAPGGGVLVIQTCWHDDDLAGRLLQAMHEDPDADQYEVVRYPAIAMEDEWITPDQSIVDTYEEGATLLRRKGECLHEARYDLDKLNRIKRTLPRRWWSSLYQQDPVPDDGGFFTSDQMRRATPPQKRNCNVGVTVDFAISEKKINDYTVIGAGLQDFDDVIHLADVTRFRSNDSTFIIDAILNMCHKFWVPGLRLGVEDGQIWKTMAKPFERRMRERVKKKTLAGYVTVIPLKPLTDKTVRASPLQARMQQGLFSFALGAPWYDVVEKELLRFPSGVHDDCVDMAAWLAQLMGQLEAPREKLPPTQESWRTKLARVRSGGEGSWLTA